MNQLCTATVESASAHAGGYEATARNGGNASICDYDGPVHNFSAAEAHHEDP